MAQPETFLTLGFAGIDWIETFLIHGPGDVQGQPIELDDEFATFILKAYEVDAKGERKVRRAFLSRSKGRSKSGFAAMVECFEALGPCRFDHFAKAGEVSYWGYEYEEGEPVGRPLTYVEILNVATEEGQAGNTYDAVYYMLHADTCSAELTAEFGKLDVGLTRINLPDKRGFIEPVTAANDSADGGKSTFIVADETHLWKLPRLKKMHQTMVRNLLKRKLASGWMLETSTMYAAGESSVAEGTHAYAKQVASGTKRDRSLLFDHRQASEKWDLNKRAERIKALAEAYGPAADWMNLEAIADSWDDPQVSEADFRRFWLNQPVSLEAVVEAVVDLATWGNLTNSKATPPTRAVAVVDVDPNRTRSSIGLASEGTAGKILLLGQFSTGTSWVVTELTKLRDKGVIDNEVALHPSSQAGALIPAIESAGFEVYRMTTQEMGAACAAFIEGVKQGAFEHVGQPELDSAITQARTRFVNEAELWDRKDRRTDISPLVAVSAAAYRHSQLVTSGQPFNVW